MVVSARSRWTSTCGLSTDSWATAWVKVLSVADSSGEKIQRGVQRPSPEGLRRAMCSQASSWAMCAHIRVADTTVRPWPTCTIAMLEQRIGSRASQRTRCSGAARMDTMTAFRMPLRSSALAMEQARMEARHPLALPWLASSKASCRLRRPSRELAAMRCPGEPPSAHLLSSFLSRRGQRRSSLSDVPARLAVWLV